MCGLTNSGWLLAFRGLNPLCSIDALPEIRGTSWVHFPASAFFLLLFSVLGFMSERLGQSGFDKVSSSFGVCPQTVNLNLLAGFPVTCSFSLSRII